MSQEKIINYEDIYITREISSLTAIKMKIIQEKIQINRPTGWTIENMEKIAKELKNIEIYNSKHNNCSA